MIPISSHWSIHHPTSRPSWCPWPLWIGLIAGHARMRDGDLSLACLNALPCPDYCRAIIAPPFAYVMRGLVSRPLLIHRHPRRGSCISGVLFNHVHVYCPKKPGSSCLLFFLRISSCLFMLTVISTQCFMWFFYELQKKYIVLDIFILVIIAYFRFLSMQTFRHWLAHTWVACHICRNTFL